MAPVLSARAAPAAGLRLTPPRRPRSRATAYRKTHAAPVAAGGNGASRHAASGLTPRRTASHATRRGRPAALPRRSWALRGRSASAAECTRAAGSKDAAWEELSATAKLNQAELLRRKAAEAIAAQAALMEARALLTAIAPPPPLRRLRRC
jgi:hypothetical protein